MASSNRQLTIAAHVAIPQIQQFGSEPYFSHYRAVSEAIRLMRARGVDVRPAAAALASLLAQAGMSGHAEANVLDSQRVQASDSGETIARNRSLREIVLAGMLRCGDHGGLALRTLRTYTEDVRGHYRRHALAVLAEEPAAVGARG